MEIIFIISWVLMLIFALCYTFIPFESKDTEGIIITWVSTLLIGWALGIVLLMLLLYLLIVKPKF